MTPRAILPLLACLLAGSALGGQLAVFDDGRTLAVRAHHVSDGTVILDLEGGGRIAIPAGRVARFEPEKPTVAPAPAETRVARWRHDAGSFADLIDEVADRHGLDGALLAAVAKVESNFDPNAVSPKGASGLLQLMPLTAERFGVKDVFDPRDNLEGGARYLRWLLDRFEGRTELALAGYNAGENAVDHYRGIPPYSETRRYVTSVLHHAALEP